MLIIRKASYDCGKFISFWPDLAVNTLKNTSSLSEQSGKTDSLEFFYIDSLAGKGIVYLKNNYYIAIDYSKIKKVAH